MDLAIHRNVWYWGKKETIIVGGGVGICHVSVENDAPKEAWLTDVSVLPVHRQHGVGNKLLTIAEGRAKLMGAAWINLWAYSDSMAHSWYLRHGYTETETDKDGIIHLSKKLG